jgi:dTDP-4-dehydrorhamnose reductase
MVCLLIVGGWGWLAQFVQDALRDVPNLEVHTTGRSERKDTPNYHVMDVLDRNCVQNVLSKVSPDAVFHIAGLTSPGACQKDPTRALSINAPSVMLEAIKPDVLYVYCSTDLVYDGENAPYVEISQNVSPVNQYGLSKSTFEQRVLKLERGVVLRLSNMIGPPFRFERGGCKFLEWLIDMFTKKEFVGLRHDEIRSFVSVEDVALCFRAALLRHFPETCGTDTSNTSNVESSTPLPKGVYNIGGPEGLSRLQLGRIVATEMGGSLRVVLRKEEDGQNEQAASDGDDDGDDSWSVYESSNAESVVASGIPNPRDVSMVSISAEEAFGIKFRSMDVVVREVVCSNVGK